MVDTDPSGLPTCVPDAKKRLSITTPAGISANGLSKKKTSPPTMEATPGPSVQGNTAVHVLGADSDKKGSVPPPSDPVT